MIEHARYKGHFKLLKPTITGLRALHFYYLYLLRKAQRQPTQQVSFLLREDIRKMDELAMQAKLLCKYGIETKEQLSEFISNYEKEKEKLIYQRNILNNEKRRIMDEVAIAKHDTRRFEITNCLSIVRSELKSFYAILVRYEEIREKQAEMNNSEHCNLDYNKASIDHRAQKVIRYTDSKMDIGCPP